MSHWATNDFCLWYPKGYFTALLFLNLIYSKTEQSCFSPKFCFKPTLKPNGNTNCVQQVIIQLIRLVSIMKEKNNCWRIIRIRFLYFGQLISDSPRIPQ